MMCNYLLGWQTPLHTIVHKLSYPGLQLLKLAVIGRWLPGLLIERLIDVFLCKIFQYGHLMIWSHVLLLNCNSSRTVACGDGHKRVAWKQYWRYFKAWLWNKELVWGLDVPDMMCTISGVSNNRYNEHEKTGWKSMSLVCVPKPNGIWRFILINLRYDTKIYVLFRDIQGPASIKIRLRCIQLPFLS